MHPAVPRALFTVFSLALATTAACEDEPSPRVDDEQIRAYVEELCASMFGCDCEATPYDSEEDCTDNFYHLMRSSQLDARVAGTDYDEACARRHIDAYAQTGCMTSAEIAASFKWVTCQFYSGTKKAGETCTSLGIHMSDCAQGLACVGRCYEIGNPDPAHTLAEGEACRGPDGILGLCAEGLGCDRDADVCRMFPETGTVCASHDDCNLPGYIIGRCDAGVCAPRRSAGDACTDDAECALGCTDGECEAGAPLACIGAYL